MKKFVFAAVAALLGAALFANQYENLEPIEIDGVFAQASAGEKSRKKGQFLRIYYDAKTDLLEFSAQCRETGFFCAVFSAENRLSILDLQEAEIPCDFSWGRFKVLPSEQGRLSVKTFEGGKVLEFSCKNFAKKFCISFSDKDFTDFCFKISEQNLQALCDDALNEQADADEEFQE